MRRTLIVLLVVALAAGLAAPATAAGVATGYAQEEPDCTYPVERTDVTGETVTLEEPPDRIVALMASDAQTAFEIGAGDRVVGMPVDESTADLGAEDVTNTMADDGFTVDDETVVGLEPDVVLAGNTTDSEVVGQLRDLGLTVYHFGEAESLDEVRENVVVTGELAGECEGAAATSAWIDQRLDLVESAVADEERPLAYYEMGGGYTAGPGSFQHEAMTAAGLENVAERAGVDGWDLISEEVVFDEDPEWMVYGAGQDAPPVAESLEETTAYEAENFAPVDSNAFSQPAPDVVFAVETLLETVHPEAHASIDADLADLDERYEAGELLEDEGTDDGTETENGDENGDTSGENGDDTSGERDDGTESDDEENGTDDTETESDDTVPGFGAPAAVAGSLAALAVLVRRR